MIIWIIFNLIRHTTRTFDHSSSLVSSNSIPVIHHHRKKELTDSDLEDSDDFTSDEDIDDSEWKPRQAISRYFKSFKFIN